MSEVSDFTWQELVDSTPIEWEYHVDGMARIEGVVDGQRWAALVPATLAKDEAAAKAHLAYIARSPRTEPGIEVVG